MSTADQDAELLRIVKDRAEAKRTRSLLESKIQNTGAALSEIGSSVRNISPHTDRSFIIQQFKKHGEHAPLALFEMVKDYFVASDRVKELDARAKELGID